MAEDNVLAPPAALNRDGTVDYSKIGGELSHRDIGSGGRAKIIGDASTYQYDDKFGGLRVPHRSAEDLRGSKMLVGVPIMLDGQPLITPKTEEDACRILQSLGSPAPKTSQEPTSPGPSPTSSLAGTLTALMTPKSEPLPPGTPPLPSSGTASPPSPPEVQRSTRKRSSKGEDSELSFLRSQLSSLTNELRDLKASPGLLKSSAPSASSPPGDDVRLEFSGGFGTFECVAEAADFRDGQLLVVLYDPKKPKFLPPPTDQLGIKITKAGQVYDLQGKSFGFQTTFGIGGRDYVLVLIRLLDT